jgi:hypothetical protein
LLALVSASVVFALAARKHLDRAMKKEPSRGRGLVIHDV